MSLTAAMPARSGAPTAPARYDRVAIIYHWLTVALVVAVSLTALVAAQVEPGALKLLLARTHLALGAAVFLVTVARLFARLSRPAVPSHDLASEFHRSAARVVHATLYFLLLSLPVIGFAVPAVSGALPLLLGLPVAQAPDFTASATYALVHRVGAWALIVLVAGHAGAAIFRSVALGDGTLARMLPYRGDR